MFDIVNGKITLDADTLAIPPFKAYYSKTRDKAKVEKEIEYIVWSYRWNTPYLAYEPALRSKIIGRDVFGDEKYKPTKEMFELAERYVEFQNTPLVRLYVAAEEGLEYLIQELKALKEGNSLMKPTEVSRLLKEVEPISKSLENAKARAIAEQSDTGKVKGGGTVGFYEKPRK